MSTPYDDAVRDTRQQIITASMNIDAGRRDPVAAAVFQAGKMIASALLAVAESNRPQPAIVNVSVTDVVAEKVQEAAR